MKNALMKSVALALATTLAPVAIQAQQTGPGLVVLISVDQLRGDLLERYADVFTGGFVRLAEQGYSFEGTSHAHAVTHTAAGHATIATGVFPSRSGIVANSWAHRTAGQWQSMYAVEDLASPIVGVPELPGRSPKNLLRGGLADWVLAFDEDARVLSVSGKDRAAITMAGRAEGHVYWVNQLLGAFVTSEHYRDRYPGWVRDFNRDVMPTFTADTVWDSSVPEAQRVLARADSADYEFDGVHTVMPHWAHEERVPGDEQAQNAWALAQPAIDAAVVAFTETAIEELDLGKRRGHTDYLGLSLSATDYVGHGFGPLSQEQLDNLVRLDKVLGGFFDYLDAEIGAGNWVAAVTADHGVLTMPEYLAEQGEVAERVSATTRSSEVSQLVQEIAAAGGPRDEMIEKIARAVEEAGLVAKAYTHAELLYGAPADSFAVLYRNSYYPGRGPGWLSQLGIELRFDHQDLVSGATGTTHGSPYWYDRSVPLYFLGRGVSPGSSAGRSYTVDVAPTLAALAGIPYPDDLDGRVIYPPIF